LKTSTKLVAGASAAALALALGPAAYAGPVATEDIDGPVLASILVELDLPSFGDGAMVFFVEDVPVTDGVEMHLDDVDSVDNPSDWCGGATVDISTDLQTVTLAGGPDPCNFEEAYYEIQLTGAEWGAVSLVSDTLFEESDEPQETESPEPSPSPSPTITSTVGPAAFIMGGHKSITPSRLAFATPPLPSLEAFAVDGNSFAAYWLGDESSDMSGSAVFSFGPATAPPAEAVDSDADFAG
jgi:hypothetical protein